MEPKDRERLVRVEENVKSMRQDLSYLVRSFEKHSEEFNEDRVNNAKAISALNVKAGIWGLLGGIVIGMVDYFRK